MKLSESNRINRIFLVPKITAFLLLLIFTVTCSSTRHATFQESSDTRYSDAESNPASFIYSVFLVGDAGDAAMDPLTPSLRALADELKKLKDGNGAVVFLGDNIYPDGLEPKDSPDRSRNEEALLAQIETVRDFSGRVVFVPGNHDWESSGKTGLDYVLRQEQFVEDEMMRGNVFLPDSGMPGPVTIPLFESEDTGSSGYSISVVATDTHWWLHPHEKPMPFGASNEEMAKQSFLDSLDVQLRGKENDEIVFAVHHPFYSYGRHGAKFPLKTHLVPPVFGSIYAFYRNIWGYPQDITHKHYREMKEGILNAASRNNNVFYASGHEHGLQFIPVQRNENKFYQIVSGSATRSSYLRKKRGPVYTYERLGFAVIRYYQDQSKKVEFISDTGDVLFDRIVLPK